MRTSRRRESTRGIRKCGELPKEEYTVVCFVAITGKLDFVFFFHWFFVFSTLRSIESKFRRRKLLSVARIEQRPVFALSLSLCRGTELPVHARPESTKRDPISFVIPSHLPLSFFLSYCKTWCVYLTPFLFCPLVLRDIAFLSLLYLFERCATPETETMKRVFVRVFSSFFKHDRDRCIL